MMDYCSEVYCMRARINVSTITQARPAIRVGLFPVPEDCPPYSLTSTSWAVLLVSQLANISHRGVRCAFRTVPVGHGSRYPPDHAGSHGELRDSLCKLSIFGSFAANAGAAVIGIRPVSSGQPHIVRISQSGDSSIRFV